jgi:hypothetical protein
VKGLEANSKVQLEMLAANTKILNEYNGARKVILWISGFAAAVGGYLFGKSGGGP